MSAIQKSVFFNEIRGHRAFAVGPLPRRSEAFKASVCKARNTSFAGVQRVTEVRGSPRSPNAALRGSHRYLTSAYSEEQRQPSVGSHTGIC